MSTLSRNTLPLRDALWPVEEGGAWRRDILLIVAGACALTISAKLQVPFWPVPMTMQTFVVVLLGVLLGASRGMSSVGLYLAVGAAGLPVFASGGGLAYFSGPTAGYLIGFLLAAGLVGRLAQAGWDRRPWTCVLAMAAGHAVIFALGVAWLSVLFGAAKALEAGLYPFLLGACLKLSLAAMLLLVIWKQLDRRARG